MLALLRKFVKNESGATMVEVGLIAAGIAVALLAVIAGDVKPHH